jgi:cytochrome P450
MTVAHEPDLIEADALDAAETQPDIPLFPFPPGPFGGEPSEYAELRATCPFSKVKLGSGHEATLVLSYRDASAALADERLSRVLTGPSAPRWTKASNIFTDQVSLVNRVGPEHMRQRRIISGALTHARIEPWKPVIWDTANALLDKVRQTGPGADLMEGFFAHFPVRIMCKLVGVPLEDYPRFRRWSNAFMSTVPLTEEERVAEMADFAQYARELVARKRGQPGDGLVDIVMAAYDEGGRVSQDEMVYIILGLIAAGTDTVMNILSRITLMLLRDQRRLWDQVAAQGEVTRAVLDELLRYVQQGNGAMLRIAEQDVELPSGTIRAGQTLALPLSSAGLDETVFPEPHTLRFDRQGPRSLLFGGGAHYCVGVNVAKAELQLGLQALMTRLPGMRLAVDPAELTFTKGELLTVLTSVPVTW